MGHTPEDRTLMKWLAALAVVFAMIFAMNGFGFASRYSHVLAGDKAKEAAAERHEKAKKNGLAEVLGLMDVDAEDEATATPDALMPGKNGETRGHKGGDRPGGSVAETPATPDPETPGRGDIEAVIKKLPPGQVKKAEPPTVDSGEPAVDDAGQADAAVTDPAAATVVAGPLIGAASPPPDVTEPPTPSVEPTIVPGNPPLCEGGFKVESPSNGTHTYTHTVDGESVTITINVYDTPNGQAFDWTSSWPVERVVVKGGSLGANVYEYDPPASADGGLHAPQANENNPHWAGLSYVAFCFGDNPPPDVVKTFEVVYPDLPEGAHLWVKYQVGDADWVKVELQPAGEDTYSFVDPHIPAGSVVKGEWLLTYGEVTEVLGTFEEVLCEDKTNHFEYKPQVCGSKYEDLDGDGTWDDGEPGLGDWTITLYRKAWLIMDVGSWEPYATVKTNGDGSYCFTGLAPGLYKVEEELQEGWKQTDAPDPNEFEIDPCTNITGLDFGNVELPDITVLKYNDVNGNGQQDTGESAIPGFTFTLMKGDQLIGEKTTGEDGKAIWADLDLGTYVLDEMAREGWKATTALPVTVVLDTSGVDVTIPVGNQLIVTPGVIDLAITKAANPTVVEPGDMVTYRLTYRNLGDEPATDFTIVDDYDQSLVAEVVNAGGGVVDAVNGTITWTFAGPLAKEDGPKSVVYTVKLKSDIEDGTFVDNVAVINHPEDVDLTNNKDEARVKVEEPFLPFEEEEESLPFTGGDFTLIALLAAFSTIGGVALRRLGKDGTSA